MALRGTPVLLPARSCPESGSRRARLASEREGPESFGVDAPFIGGAALPPEFGVCGAAGCPSTALATCGVTALSPLASLCLVGDALGGESETLFVGFRDTLGLSMGAFKSRTALLARSCSFPSFGDAEAETDRSRAAKPFPCLSVDLSEPLAGGSEASTGFATMPTLIRRPPSFARCSRRS